ncbi:MAG: hypothetical protein AB1591_02760 [Pseudomonadota bacterium]
MAINNSPLAENSPAFAQDSPTLEPLGDKAIRPIRPIRPDEREKLIALVEACAAHYQFTPAETSEAIRLALEDHEAALQCFENIAEQINNS